jgi:hypothetical protein
MQDEHCLKIEKLVKEIRNKKTSDTVFLIGGGPSVLKYCPDPNILKGKDIIAGNNAYKLFPNAILCHFMDKTWLKWHMEPEHDLFNTFTNPITSCLDVNREELYNYDITIFYKGSPDGKGSLTSDVHKLEGNNTGHQMINIAAHLKYKNVILLGYDLHHEKQSNWHTDHRRATNFANFKNTMIPGFNKITDDVQQKLGIKIYNVNRQSALKCFEFTNLQDWL